MIRTAVITDADCIYALICDMEQTVLDKCKFDKIFTELIEMPIITFWFMKIIKKFRVYCICAQNTSCTTARKLPKLWNYP
ncbi:MAG: hypothetical protein AAGU14_07570 [Eubacteriaceae bacterium]